jgi:hypothetical protein
MKKLIAAAVVSVAWLAVGCTGGNGVIGSPNLDLLNGIAGGSSPTTPSSNTALFHLSSGQLPYPTDLYFAGSTDGALNIQPPNALWPNQQFVNMLDGFSTNAVIREQFGGALDPTSFTASSILIVPVVTDNLTKATTGFLGGTPAPLVPGTDYSAALATDAGVGPQILEITPLHPLRPSTCISNGQFLAANCKTGTGYLVILTSGIKDSLGHGAVPDADYATIKAALAGGPTCPSITDKTLNGVCQLTGAHLQLAQALGVNPANIVLTFSFTTEATVDTLELMSATADPTKQTIKVNPTGITTHQVNPLLPGHADVYVGALTVPYYLSATAPLTASWQAPPFPLDATSRKVTRFNPLPVATNANLMIPVLVTVPNASSLHGAVPPAGGWPVLIFQHGITRSREDMFGVADSFADAGFVVAAIDLPLHGVTNTHDPLYASAANPLYAGLGLPASQMSIERTFDLDLNTNAGNTVLAGSPPDGVIDPSGSHVINLTSPLVTRDGLRQGAIDLVMLSRLLPSLSLGAAGTVNASGIHYLGHSLGAIEGTVFMGVVGPGVSTATLANPGGELPQILITSPSFETQINAGLLAQGLVPGTTLYANFWRDIQSLWDAGDPVNYIALATAAHPIHLIQVVGSTPQPAGCNPVTPPNGCPDQVVPNPTTKALITASAYGPAGAAGALTRIAAGQAPVVANPSGIRGYVNFIQGDHGSIIDNVVPAVTQEMQTEAISFTGAPIPPAGIAANTPGTTLLIANPAVIQP